MTGVDVQVLRCLPAGPGKNYLASCEVFITFRQGGLLALRRSYKNDKGEWVNYDGDEVVSSANFSYRARGLYLRRTDAGGVMVSSESGLPFDLAQAVAAACYRVYEEKLAELSPA